MPDLIEGKVVRDKLPLEIAKSTEISLKKLTGEEAYCHLLLKLQEELTELYEARKLSGDVNGFVKFVEEIADCIEVLVAIGKLHGAKASGIIDAVNEKYEAKGGFDEVFFVKILDGNQED